MDDKLKYEKSIEDTYRSLVYRFYSVFGRIKFMSVYRFFVLSKVKSHLVPRLREVREIHRRMTNVKNTKDKEEIIELSKTDKDFYLEKLRKDIKRFFELSITCHTIVSKFGDTSPKGLSFKKLLNMIIPSQISDEGLYNYKGVIMTFSRLKFNDKTDLVLKKDPFLKGDFSIFDAIAETVTWFEVNSKLEYYPELKEGIAEKLDEEVIPDLRDIVMKYIGY